MAGASNVIKNWKGAVQPAESSPSGNEIRLWKGAVQPAAATATPGRSFTGGLVRNLVGKLVRPLVR